MSIVLIFVVHVVLWRHVDATGDVRQLLDSNEARRHCN